MKIHTADDGTLYRENVTVLYNDSMVFEANPDMLYSLISHGIRSMAMQETKPAQGESVETLNLRTRVSKLAKQALRGGLLMFGNDLLTLLYGTKEHAKLPKGEDSLDWYTDQFAKIGVAYLLKQELILNGQEVMRENATIFYSVESLVARPVARPMETTEATTV